jgi:hypothetical protein
VSAFLAGLVLGQLFGIGTTGREATTLTVSDRTETRLRSSIVAFGNDLGKGTTAFDVENLLVGTLITGRHHKSLQLSYSPRFAYLDITGDRQLALMHTGRAIGSWWTRRLRLTLSLDGSIGTQSAVTALAPVNFDAGRAAQAQAPGAAPQNPAVPPQQPVPQNGATYLPLAARALVLYIGSWRATAGATYLLTRRLTGTGSVNYGALGGLNYDSQQTNPPSRGPGADAALTYKLTRRDALATTVSTSYTTVLATPLQGVPLGPNRSYFIFSAVESWRHNLSPRTISVLGAGFSYLGNQVSPGYPDNSGVTGNADASISHTDVLGHETTLDYRASASLGVQFNPVVGTAQQTISFVGSSVWTHKKVNATLSGSALATIPWDSPIATRTINGTFAVGYTPARAVLLQAGVRGYMQVFPTSYVQAVTQPPPGQAPVTQPNTLRTPPQWMAFLAVTVFVPVLAF